MTCHPNDPNCIWHPYFDVIDKFIDDTDLSELSVSTQDRIKTYMEDAYYFANNDYNEFINLYNEALDEDFDPDYYY